MHVFVRVQAGGVTYVCVFACRLVVGQFPPSVLELLVLIGGGGIDLDRRSILEGTFPAIEMSLV